MRGEERSLPAQTFRPPSHWRRSRGGGGGQGGVRGGGGGGVRRADLRAAGLVCQWRGWRQGGKSTRVRCLRARSVK